MSDFGGDHFSMARAFYGRDPYSDESITERLYKSYAKDRNDGETHEDMAKCYGSDAAQFLKRYDEEQAEHSAVMMRRVA